MKRIISILLTFALICGMLAMMATAAEVFSDVESSAWYAEDVAFVTEQGLMNGIGNNKFGPNETTTRAMIATILWRMEGSPAPKESSGFKDVPDGQWYSDAVAWMKEANLTNGQGNNEFGTNDPINREALATFMYRYWMEKGGDGENYGNYGTFDGYTDYEKVSDWARKPLLWAIKYPIISGKAGAKLDPQGKATRAEFAAMLHRYIDPAPLPDNPDNPDVTLVGIKTTGTPAHPEFFVIDHFIDTNGVFVFAVYSDGTEVELNLGDINCGVEVIVPEVTESGPVEVVFSYRGFSTTVTFYAKVVTEVVPIDAEKASKYGNKLIEEAGATVDMTRTLDNSSYRPYPGYTTEYINAHGGQTFLEEEVAAWVNSNITVFKTYLESRDHPAEYLKYYNCRCVVDYNAESDSYYIVFLYE